MSRKALITGCLGQDGSYLTDLLLERGYEVHGLVRTSTVPLEKRPNTQHLLDHLDKDFFLHKGDLTDSASLSRVIKQVNPDEIYNLGAMTHVQDSFATPTLAIDINGNGLIRILEIILDYNPGIKVYQASTSELYGNLNAVGGLFDTPRRLNEDSEMNPQSPYAWGKQVAYQAANIYRDGYGLFVCNGILFNHESPRRGVEYVTRKITKAAARIYLGLQDKLYLGNLDAKRDWGFAGDYVQAMWMMMQEDVPRNYVIGTGYTYSVREFLETAFAYVNLDPYRYIEQKKELRRPADVNILCADASKAKTTLGFTPTVSFQELVEMMVEHDLKEEQPKHSGRIIHGDEY